MKPGTYTNPGIPLYQNGIDRCEHDIMTNDGIVSFGMSWSELLFRNPNIAYIHPQLLQRCYDLHETLKNKYIKTVNNKQDIKVKKLFENKYAKDLNSLLEKKRPKIWDKQMLIFPQNIANSHWNLYIVFNPSHIMNNIKRMNGGNGDENNKHFSRVASFSTRLVITTAE